MAFSISQKTLERLEWPVVLARLAHHARTPRARSALIEGRVAFAESIAAMRERLAETREAVSLLEMGDPPPLGGVGEISEGLVRARKGGALDAEALRRVAGTLAALAATRRFVAGRVETAPGLAALAEAIEPHAVLRAEIDGAIDESGEVRDEASAALAEARRDARRLAAEIQERIARMLRDPRVQPHLSDNWSTLRSDRYVLPVRSDARSAVRGIVHDASRSGTTLFVEPEALVEINNRHKRAELSAAQEVRRVLAELSGAVAEAADDIERGLDTLARLDLAFARGHYARAIGAVEPDVGDEGILSLPQLRHPLIPAEESVANDLVLGREFRLLVLSGPNAGGKTVTMKSAALALLFARAGLFVAADAPARVDAFDALLADIGDEQDIREHLSTFSAHMANVAQIVKRADARSLVVLDEVGVGTDPGEGAAIAQAALEALADAGARVLATTHYGLLKEIAEVDERFANASVEFDPETLAPSYRLRMGLPGASSAAAVAARMGMPRNVLERAEALLSRDDRRLDRMLAELASSRATLEREQREAHRLRTEGEAARNEYSAKLDTLRERREKLYHGMRDALDGAFRDAHEQIASVIRELQRGGSAQEAARAREQLLALERDAKTRADVRPPEPLAPFDWNRARPGDRVQVQGAGSAVLHTLPDRKGRVSVGVGSAKLVVPMERVGAAPGLAPEAAPGPRVDAPALAEGGSGRCDLRGMRVDEALDRLVEALDAASAAGNDRLTVVHGVGTGALRRAVREHLNDSRYVVRIVSEDPERGGDGITHAELDT